MPCNRMEGIIGEKSKQAVTLNEAEPAGERVDEGTEPDALHNAADEESQPPDRLPVGLLRSGWLRILEPQHHGQMVRLPVGQPPSTGSSIPRDPRIRPG